MPSESSEPLTIRSAYARQRVRAIAEHTGMTTTEIVEDALRGYVPPDRTPAPGAARKRPLLVFHLESGHPPITPESVQAMIEADREDRLDEVINPPE